MKKYTAGFNEDTSNSEPTDEFCEKMKEEEEQNGNDYSALYDDERMTSIMAERGCYTRPNVDDGEDSSYDSDLESEGSNSCCEEGFVDYRSRSRQTSVSFIKRANDDECDHNNGEEIAADLSLCHESVSRSVSDTLGAEFLEYVSTVDERAATQGEGKNQEAGNGKVKEEDEEEEEEEEEREENVSCFEIGPVASVGYAARLEFALKLGYSENLVQAALRKLGPEPQQNELLAELVRLGSQKSKFGANDEDESIVVVDGDVNNISLVESINAHSHPGVNNDIPFEKAKLRPIVIDGSNVAMSHGNRQVFSCRGIRICVDWFLARGHTEITVFVPKWRKESPRPDNLIADKEILHQLERERLLVFTPSKEVRGKRVACYDDRYILKLATENEGIVVSNDSYKDLVQQSPEFRKVIEERVLMFSFVNDRFMPPDDPLGRSGPTLDNFLRMAASPGGARNVGCGERCPYGKKCTYGVKCKYNHPERTIKAHLQRCTERFLEDSQRHQLRDVAAAGKQLKGKSLSLPLQQQFKQSETAANGKVLLTRARSSIVTAETTSSLFSSPSSSSSVLFPFSNPLSSTASSPLPPPHPSSSSSSHSFYQCNSDSNNAGIRTSPCSVSQPSPCSGSWFVPPQQQNVIYFHSSANLRCSSPSDCNSVGWNERRDRSLMEYKQQKSDTEVRISEECGGGGGAEDKNLHRKLQRELSINPVDDVRLHQMRRYQRPVEHKRNQHRPVGRNYSYHSDSRHPPSGGGGGGLFHANVTRNASAPVSDSVSVVSAHYHPLTTSVIGSGNISSISEPRLPSAAFLAAAGAGGQRVTNLTGCPIVITSSSSSLYYSPSSAASSSSVSRDEVRRKLRYHLSSIFSQQQVDIAMGMNPDETDARKICATLLSTFPTSTM